MNTARHIERRKTPRSNVGTAAVAGPTRTHRERDFGVGYGSSSGYGSNRRYVDSRGGSFFRCR